jgi:S-adenosyl-L-methionine hydrolase (adenosine-forming)
MRYDTISFLSDYGHADEFVGVVHSVIRQLEPAASVIDITHGIPPFDVRTGALTLARSVQYLTPGVVLAVVDPGVGSTRRAVAVEVADGQSVLLGPDNGLLAPAVGMVGGATRAVQLTNPEFHLEAPGPSFDGRDVFAPAAAHLCSGTPLEELGEEIDPAGMVPGILPLSQDIPGGLEAEVLWVDRFGNAQLNVDPDELDALGTSFELRFGERRVSARRVHHFGEITVGAVGLMVDSYGLIAIAADRSSASEELRIDAGDGVTITALDGDGAPPSQEIPVRLGRRDATDGTTGGPGGAPA